MVAENAKSIDKSAFIALRAQQPSVFFSILTPSWNRIEGLIKLYNSLRIQQKVSFEWIVGDDGSLDGSLEYLLATSNVSPFPLRIISTNLRIGKACMDNLLLESVSGLYYICCDSDDWFLPDSLYSLWCALIPHVRMGRPLDLAVSRNITTFGYPTSSIGAPFDYLMPCRDILPRIDGDATLVLLSSGFTSYKHEEIDFIVTESLFYSNVNLHLMGVVLSFFSKVMDRSFQNSVSFSRGIKYCRGSAFSVRKHISSSSCPPDMNQCLNLIRYSINAELSLQFYLPLLLIRCKTLFFRMRVILLLLPIGFILAIRDLLFGGLVRTHREFDANKLVAHITYFHSD